VQYTIINTIITKLDYKYSKVRIFMQKNKIKIIEIYFCIFNEHLECGERMSRIWNATARIKLIKPYSRIKSITFFSNKCQCQPTIILKPKFLNKISLRLSLDRQLLDQLYK